MRQGFKQAVSHVITSGRPTSVRAVILMTDGNWNQGGSPLAVGKGYDLNTWVRDNRDSAVSTPYYGFSRWQQILKMKTIAGILVWEVRIFLRAVKRL